MCDDTESQTVKGWRSEQTNESLPSRSHREVPFRLREAEEKITLFLVYPVSLTPTTPPSFSHSLSLSFSLSLSEEQKGCILDRSLPRVYFTHECTCTHSHTHTRMCEWAFCSAGNRNAGMRYSALLKYLCHFKGVI